MLHKIAYNTITNPYLRITLFTKHLAPFSFLTFDFWMNDLKLSSKSLRYNNLFNTCYMIFNMIIALYDNPIYPMITYKD